MQKYYPINTRRPVFFLCLLLLLVQTSVWAKDQDLKLGIHPYQSAINLVEKFSPFANYLAQVLNQPVKIVISHDYQHHIDQVGANTYDIAYMGPASYVKLVEKFGPPPLLARLEVNHKPVFQGKIFTRADSDISELEDLKGKRFAFGSKSSTMSYLVPRYVLEQAGVNLESLGTYEFLGNHKNVMLSVLMGKFDAGAVKEAVYNEYQDRGIKLLTNTPALSEHLFVASSDINTDLENKIKTALLTMHENPEGKSALQQIKSSITQLVAVKDSDYDTLRNIILD